MEISIVEQHPNPLLKRTEYRFEIHHSAAATPSRDAVRAELAKSVQAPKERIVIERMHSRFGTSRTLGEAAVYQTVDDAKTIVREHILLRNKVIEKATTTAATPAEAPAEAPAKEAPKAVAPQGDSAPSEVAKPEATKPEAPKKGGPKKEA